MTFTTTSSRWVVCIPFPPSTSSPHPLKEHYNPLTFSLAFAFFNPGQFSKLYPEIVKPAANGNLHICGEAASTHHAWIVGALESAWRGVFEILVKEKRDDLIEELKNKYGVPEDMPLYAANAQVLRGIDVSDVGV
jgi:hypothetical protein